MASCESWHLDLCTSYAWPVVAMSDLSIWWTGIIFSESNSSLLTVTVSTSISLVCWIGRFTKKWLSELEVGKRLLTTGFSSYCKVIKNCLMWKLICHYYVNITIDFNSLVCCIIHSSTPQSCTHNSKLVLYEGLRTILGSIPDKQHNIMEIWTVLGFPYFTMKKKLSML